MLGLFEDGSDVRDGQGSNDEDVCMLACVSDPRQGQGDSLRCALDSLTTMKATRVTTDRASISRVVSILLKRSVCDI
jgi:hypothetical protein